MKSSGIWSSAAERRHRRTTSNEELGSLSKIALTWQDSRARTIFPLMSNDWLASLREVLRHARSDGRRLLADGEDWTVYELPAQPFDRRTSPVLVFESENIVRRVRNFPSRWRELTDVDLYALSLST